MIILTHDWSFLKGLIAINKVNECISSFHALAYNGVSIGENSFIGAGAVILPGTKIGKFCIIGAGSVVKGNIILLWSVILARLSMTRESLGKNF